MKLLVEENIDRHDYRGPEENLPRGFKSPESQEKSPYIQLKKQNALPSRWRHSSSYSAMILLSSLFAALIAGLRLISKALSCSRVAEEIRKAYTELHFIPDS
jgi:hypothetical protein